MTMTKSPSNPASETRFVVLRHVDRDDAHFDLMIDLGHALATWKMAQPPELCRDAPMRCARIGDHRRIYLDYEGPVSGNRGDVSVYDQGTCSIDTAEPARWELRFNGRRMLGWFLLELAADEPQSWSLRPRPA